MTTATCGGRYDKLVSIEMIEAVGWQHIGTFFQRCSELLAPHGAMLLQAITIDDRAYEVEKASKSFIKEYIFPGGCLPSLEVIARNVARRTDLQTVGLEDITASYVETLRRWRQNFAASSTELESTRLRRALPAALDAVSGLLRGGVRRAAHLRRAVAVGQAAMGRPPPRKPAERGAVGRRLIRSGPTHPADQPVRTPSSRSTRWAIANAALAAGTPA